LGGRIGWGERGGNTTTNPIDKPLVEVLLKIPNEHFFLSLKKNGTNNSLNFEKSKLVHCFFSPIF
jgi:hypothetical protein